jgi:hypothetical protein
MNQSLSLIAATLLLSSCYLTVVNAPAMAEETPTVQERQTEQASQTIKNARERNIEETRRDTEVIQQQQQRAIDQAQQDYRDAVKAAESLPADQRQAAVTKAKAEQEATMEKIQARTRDELTKMRARNLEQERNTAAEVRKN